MKVAFLTEIPFRGKYDAQSMNTRTEIAWMIALQADHYNLDDYRQVEGFDIVFIIWPKATLRLNAEGVLLENPYPEKRLNQLCKSGEISNIIPVLKERNKKVAFIQEGPGWLYEDYTLQEQVMYIKLLQESDAIFCHNESDIKYYRHYGKPVYVLHSLIIEDTIRDINPVPEQKIIIGGNFCRWYGGIKSYMIANSVSNSQYEIWAPSMHNRQENEDAFVKHLPYLRWTYWMQALSSFKLGIHMMPTVAAGTFSLNCAYLGIPVIGNINVDTQKYCHPALSIDPDDVSTAILLANNLLNDLNFYRECSEQSRQMARTLFIKGPWLDRMSKILEDLVQR